MSHRILSPLHPHRRAHHLILTTCRFSSYSNHSKPKPKPKPIILSGIQPTGVPHLGNYLGAIKSWVDLQTISATQLTLPPRSTSSSSSASIPLPKPTIGDRTTTESPQLFYSIVDLHALTVPQDPVELSNRILLTTRVLLSCGINPDKSVLFQQSQVPEHTMLCWMLGCQTPMGWLNRMTQWKSKLAAQKNKPLQNENENENENVNPLDPNSGLDLGLFSYPVLQAADILVYRATHVPVGEDQQQHLELTRDIARSFNKRYKVKYFPEPVSLITPTKKIYSLRHPTQKMSKSATKVHPNAIISITDSPSVIAKKIKKSTTDSVPTISYDPVNRPGVSNLLNIYAGFTGRSVEEVIERNEFAGMGIEQLKGVVTEVVVEGLRDVRENVARLEKEGGKVEREVLKVGMEKARETASENLKRAMEVMGIHGVL